MRTILCTVGTSVARECPSLKQLQVQGSNWETDTSALEDEIDQRIRLLDLSTESGRVSASAEIHSLHKIEIRKDDEVILLTTDTADGRACATKLANLIEKTWPGTTVRVKRIEGLQVRDPELLRSKGLVGLLNVTIGYIKDPQRKYSNPNGDSIIINPTAGFKGVVPFLAVLGMLFQVPTVYMFEFANSIVRLPPLPLGFDLKIFRRARRALEMIKKEGAIHEKSFFNQIIAFQEHERAMFESLLERDGELVTLSPLAEVLSDVVQEGQQPLWISPQAIDQLNKRQGTDRMRLEAFLIRLSNPIWRASQPHRFQNCEIPVFGNSRYCFRAAVHNQDNKLYICRIYDDHDKYETELGHFRKKDIEPLQDFQRWEAPMTEEELDEKEQDESTSLNVRLEEMSLELNRAKTKLGELIKENEKLKAFRGRTKTAGEIGRKKEGQKEKKEEMNTVPGSRVRRSGVRT